MARVHYFVGRARLRSLPESKFNDFLFLRMCVYVFQSSASLAQSTRSGQLGQPAGTSGSAGFGSPGVAGASG